MLLDILVYPFHIHSSYVTYYIHINVVIPKVFMGKTVNTTMRTLEKSHKHTIHTTAKALQRRQNMKMERKTSHFTTSYRLQFVDANM